MGFLIIFLAIVVVAALISASKPRYVAYHTPDHVVPLHTSEGAAPNDVAGSHMIAINEHIQHAMANVGAVRKYHADEAQRVLNSLRTELPNLPFQVQGIIEAQAAIDRLK